MIKFYLTKLCKKQTPFKGNINSQRPWESSFNLEKKKALIKIRAVGIYVTSGRLELPPWEPESHVLSS